MHEERKRIRRKNRGQETEIKEEERKWEFFSST